MLTDLDIIRTRKPRLVGEETLFRSAVCIPLIEGEAGYRLLFEVRSGTLSAQPGDICFPGGRIEEGEDPEEAAVRELCEELLVGRDNIEIIGPADIFHTENIIVYPYAGILRGYEGTFDEEVESVFTVPLEYFLNTEPEMYRMEYDLHPDPDFPYERIHGGVNYNWRGRTTYQYFYEYDGHWIWGLTAKLVRSFADLFR